MVEITSPLLYLYRIQALDWLPALGGDVRIPKAVELELQEGRRRGYDVPDPAGYDWLRIAGDRVPMNDRGVQIIEKDGRPEYAVVPIDEYRRCGRGGDTAG